MWNNALTKEQIEQIVERYLDYPASAAHYWWDWNNPAKPPLPYNDGEPTPTEVSEHREALAECGCPATLAACLTGRPAVDWFDELHEQVSGFMDALECPKDGDYRQSVANDLRTYLETAYLN